MKATFTGEQLKFLGGVILAVLILFVSWWFVFHNRYERVTEENVNELAQAINEVCENGGTKEITFYAPQASGFKGELYQMAGGVGLGNLAGTLLGTVDVGTEPYMYVFYEHFPYEDSGIPIVSPWSEEMPWSGNILATAFLDSIFVGASFGFEKIGAKITEKIGTEVVEETTEEVAEEVTESLFSRIKKEGVELIKEGEEILIKTKKYALRLGGEYAASVVLCYSFTDAKLEDCLVYGVLGVPIMEAGRYALNGVWKSIKEEFTEHVVVNTLSKGTVKELVLDAFENGNTEFIENLVEKGYVEIVDGMPVINGQYYEVLQEWWEYAGKPENLGYFFFESTNGELTKVGVDRKEFLYSTGSSIWGKIEGVLGENVEENVLTPHAQEIIGEQLKSIPLERKRNILSRMIEKNVMEEINLENDELVEETFNKIGDVFVNRAEAGDMLFVKTGTSLGYTAGLSALDDASLQHEVELWTLALSGESTHGGLQNIYYDIIQQNPTEFSDIKELIDGGRSLRITETTKNAFEFVDYTFLRIQDMYTPLGVTYWDLKFSPVKLSMGGCTPGSLCLTSGSTVGRTMAISLDSCASNNIDVKLKRSSLLASNPDFYLVSPCFAHLEIYKEGNTVFVEPKICENRAGEYQNLPNYCFATAGLVNYYTGMEAGGLVGEVACSVITAVTTGGAASPFCDLIGLTMDLVREASTVYPYIPVWVQDDVWEGTC